jgi:hypothetical protein
MIRRMTRRLVWAFPGLVAMHRVDRADRLPGHIGADPAS